MEPTLVKIHAPKPEIQNRTPVADSGRLATIMVAVVLGAGLVAATIATVIAGPAGLIFAMQASGLLITIAFVIAAVCRLSSR